MAALHNTGRTRAGAAPGDNAAPHIGENSVRHGLAGGIHGIPASRTWHGWTGKRIGWERFSEQQAEQSDTVFILIGAEQKTRQYRIPKNTKVGQT
jgi:hypothetical protein